MDHSITQIKKRIETNWIKILRTALRTAYPYGLVDQVGDDYGKDKTELVGVKFPSLSRTHSRTKRIKYNCVNKMSGN